MTALRAGLVGLGAMGHHHARVLNDLDGVELVGVVDPDQLSRIDASTTFADLDELISAGIDYCVVAVPTAAHEEVGLRLADAGVHVLMEKPLAKDIEASTSLTNAFEERGLIAAVGHIERYNPAIREARRRMAVGEIGQIHQIVTRRQSQFPERVADVGVVFDLATHDIDLTAWIAQAPYASVSARTAYRSGREYEDLVSVLGILTDGTVTNHVVNWLSPFKERTTVITGEFGALVADTMSSDLTFFANGVEHEPWPGVATFRGVREGDIVRYAIAKPEPLRVEHQSFRDAVLGEGSDIITMREALATVTVAAAILESARTGTTIDLPHS